MKPELGRSVTEAHLLANDVTKRLRLSIVPDDMIAEIERVRDELAEAIYLDPELFGDARDIEVLADKVHERDVVIDGLEKEIANVERERDEAKQMLECDPDETKRKLAQALAEIERMKTVVDSHSEAVAAYKRDAARSDARCRELQSKMATWAVDGDSVATAAYYQGEWDKAIRGKARLVATISKTLEPRADGRNRKVINEAFAEARHTILTADHEERE